MLLEKNAFASSFTLPKTNSLPLKLGRPKRQFHLPTIHFQARTVSFRECNWWFKHLNFRASPKWKGTSWKIIWTKPPWLSVQNVNFRWCSYCLVGGFNSFEKYARQLRSFPPSRGENEKYYIWIVYNHQVPFFWDLSIPFGSSTSLMLSIYILR